MLQARKLTEGETQAPDRAFGLRIRRHQGRPMQNPSPVQAFDDLLAHIPVSGAAKAELAAMMQAEDRFYHSFEHLGILWRRHRLHGGGEGFAPPLDVSIACAIAYHDCVCDPRRQDNERKSAELWLSASADCGLDKSERDWVAGTILATRDHLGYRPDVAFSHDPSPNNIAPPAERARFWMLDLDLTPLGETPEVFERNTAALRRKSSHLGDAEWATANRKFLGRLFGAPRIYRTATLNELYEARARRNIGRALGGA